jgi:hypothetical protein
MFHKKEMVDWENKPILIKDNYIKAKSYFEQLVIKTYMQHSGGTSAKQVNKSTNMAADIGNKQQKYNQ